MNTNVNLEKVQADAVDIFNSGFACSESIIYSIKKNFDVTIPEDAIAMSSGFPWGLGSGCICGALAGGTMSLGYFFGRRNPGESQDKIFETTKKLHHEFKKNHGSTCCRILTKNYEATSPKRKQHCTSIVGSTASYTALLIMRSL